MKKQHQVILVGVIVLILLIHMLSFGNSNYSCYQSASCQILAGKRAIFLGDSLCAGTTVDKGSGKYGYGWAGLIGERNEMVWENFGRNGAVITHIEGQDRIVSDQLERAMKKYDSVDYILFEGGCNDADQLHKEAKALGMIADGYDSFDCSTFTGALEQLILDMLTTYPDAKIGYLIPPKMGSSPYDAPENLRRQYYDRAVAVCEKWGISVLDLWNENPMNPELDVYFDSGIPKEEASAAGKFYTDGQHLTLRGYERILSQIEGFMREL